MTTRPDPVRGFGRAPGTRLETPLQILIFELAGQRYALSLEEVREVVRVVEITPLAGAPPLVEGVFDLRGRLVPVMDARRRLGLPAKPVAVTDQLLVAETRAGMVALRVDATSWLREIDPAVLDSARELAPGAAFLRGVARLPDGLVIIPDLARFLSGPEADALEEALGAHASRGEQA